MEFYIVKKIFYHDTDCGGVVYYGNYLKYLEESRTEYFQSCGIELKGLEKEGVWFVVKSINLDYKSPAKYLEKLKVYSDIKEISKSSLVLKHKIVKEKEILVKAEVKLVCVNDKFKPIRIPKKVKKKVSRSGF